MYPWRAAVSSLADWANRHDLTIDALGLVTLLGAEQVNACIGRLVQSSWLEFLPLLGAFVVAGNQLTEKKPGYRMYNLTAGVTTTELAGWFSRWMKAQDFHKTRSKVEWIVEPEDKQNRRLLTFWLPSVAVGLALNGMLLVLTVCSDDWFGFANTVAMIISVIVREIVIIQNRAGIDRCIDKSKQKALENSGKYGSDDPDPARCLVILDDCRAVTIEGPSYLMGGVFTEQPDIPNKRLYLFARWIGWVAFAVHILSLGMADLPAQIYTALLMIIATVLVTYKFGCEDSNLWRGLTGAPAMDDNEIRYCWITSRLQAKISVYHSSWTHWAKDLRTNPTYAPSDSDINTTTIVTVDEVTTVALSDVSVQEEPNFERQENNRFLPVCCRGKALRRQTTALVEDEYGENANPSKIPTTESNPLSGFWFFSRRWKSREQTDVENAMSRLPKPNIEMSDGRQDLYVWMDVTDWQWNLLHKWDLLPHGEQWQDECARKKLYHKYKHREAV